MVRRNLILFEEEEIKNEVVKKVEIEIPKKVKSKYRPKELRTNKLEKHIWKNLVS